MLLVIDLYAARDVELQKEKLRFWLSMFVRHDNSQFRVFVVGTKSDKLLDRKDEKLLKLGHKDDVPWLSESENDLTGWTLSPNDKHELLKSFPNVTIEDSDWFSVNAKLPAMPRTAALRARLCAVGAVIMRRETQPMSLPKLDQYLKKLRLTFGIISGQLLRHHVTTFLRQDLKDSAAQLTGILLALQFGF